MPQRDRGGWKVLADGLTHCWLGSFHGLRRNNSISKYICYMVTGYLMISDNISCWHEMSVTPTLYVHTYQGSCTDLLGSVSSPCVNQYSLSPLSNFCFPPLASLLASHICFLSFISGAEECFKPAI